MGLVCPREDLSIAKVALPTTAVIRDQSVSSAGEQTKKTAQTMEYYTAIRRLNSTGAIAYMDPERGGSIK